MHDLVGHCGRVHARVRAVLEAMERCDFRSQRTAVELHGFFASAIEVQVGLHLHGISFTGCRGYRGKLSERREKTASHGWDGLPYTFVSGATINKLESVRQA